MVTLLLAVQSVHIVTSGHSQPVTCWCAVESSQPMFSLHQITIFQTFSATTWMDLEGIMLSEISQKEKDKYRTIPLICVI